MEHIEVYNYCTNYERYRTLSNKNKNSFDYEVLDSKRKKSRKIRQIQINNML